MGNYPLYRKPAQELDTFIQEYLRPSEDSQKRIDKAVDTICAVLQEARVTSVAKVSAGLGSGVSGSQEGPWQSNVVMITYVCRALDARDIILSCPPSSERMSYGVGFESAGSGAGCASDCLLCDRDRLLNLSVLRSLNL